MSDLACERRVCRVLVQEGSLLSDSESSDEGIGQREAGLSFPGLGVQPPTPSWGNMLNSAQNLTTLERYPHLWVPPGLMIAITVLAINFIGDGLRDALDPKQVIK